MGNAEDAAGDAQRERGDGSAVVLSASTALSTLGATVAARAMRDLAPPRNVVGLYSGSATDCDVLEKLVRATPYTGSLVRLESLGACEEAISGRTVEVLLTLGWGSTAAIEAAARHDATSVLLQLGSAGCLDSHVRAWEAGATLTHPVDLEEPGKAEHLAHTLEVALAHARRGRPEPRERLVLWAEDEETVLDVVSRWLAQFPQPARVVGARDGNEAIRAFEEHGDRIDVIVSDWSMPHLTGSGFFTAVATRARGRIPLVFEETGNQLDVWSNMPHAALAAVHGRVSITPILGGITSTTFDRLFAIRDAMRGVCK